MATYYGGTGNDTILGSILNDTLFGNAGNDSLNGGWLDDQIYGGTGDDTILGDLGYDRLYGDVGNDLIYGGDDTYDDSYGGDGNDTIYGGNSGGDYSFGGAGDDLIYDGDGNDLSRGEQGNDTLYGGLGNDTDAGGTGNDQVYGGAGNDSVAGDDGRDSVFGGTENDTVQGGQGSDLLDGGDGADLIRGDIRTFSPGAYPSGGTGSATTFAVTNSSTLTVDLYWIDGSGVTHLQATLLPGQSWSGATLSDSNYMLTDATTGDYLSVYVGGMNQTISFTEDFNDTITGGQGADTIYGDYGSDSVDAGSEHDLVYGGAGNDTVTGGAGDDTIDLGAGDDAVGDWSNNAGNDLIYGGAGNDLIYGGADTDTLYGGSGNDTLSGGVGADTIYGGSGNDVAIITDDHQSDLYDMGEEAGDADALWFGNYVLTQGVSVTFTGTDAGTYGYAGGASGSFAGVEQISGTAYGDTITAAADSDGVTIWGNDGADSITGGSGADVIEGGAGNDTIYTDLGNDTAYGGAGDDLIDDRPGTAPDGYQQLVYGGAGNDTVYTGGGADTIFGGDGNDALMGEAGSDLILGEAGNDTLAGGAGEDTLYGGAGADSVSGDAGNDLILVDDGDGASDLAYGGAGNDTLIARIDYTGGSDSLYGGADRDVLIAGAGSHVEGGEAGDDFDTLDLSSTPYVGANVTFSGDGAGTASSMGFTLTFSEIEAIKTTDHGDSVDAGADSGGMQVTLGAGDDSAIGGSGSDTIYGETGNDLIRGGSGNDRLFGDAGNDALAGGAGNDTLTGGGGADVFGFDPGSGVDRVTDFDMTLVDGHTTDRLDVSDLRNPDGSPLHWGDFTLADDGQGNTLLTFPQGEAVVLVGVAPGRLGKLEAHQMGLPCFTAGTLIDTPGGRRRVEALRAGDLVLTPAGPAPVLWAGGRQIGAEELAARPELRPVLIRRGALGNDRPLILSRQHAVLIAGPGGVPALARAGQLAKLGKGAFRVQAGRRRVWYHHLLLARHGLVRANGAWVETLWPGPAALAGLGAGAVAEISLALPWLGEALAAPGLVPLFYGPRIAPVLTGPVLRALPRLAPVGGESLPGTAHPPKARAALREMNKFPAEPHQTAPFSRIAP